MALDTCFSGQTVAALGFTALSQQSRNIPLMRADLPKQHLTSSALQGMQFMTNDYIKGKAGFYMMLESFSQSRKCERMIAKIKFPVPIHLLDHLIIPIHVRDSHWFPAHIDLKSRCVSFLDSSHAYSAAEYPRQKMLLWKFYRMAWTAHANANAPAPSWIMHPARITSLHPRLTALTPVMVQTLGKQKDLTVDSIIATVDDRIVAKWKRRGVCPWSARDQFSVPSCQN